MLIMNYRMDFIWREESNISSKNYFRRVKGDQERMTSEKKI